MAHVAKIALEIDNLMIHKIQESRTVQETLEVRWKKNQLWI